MSFMKPTWGRWSKDLKTTGALEEAKRAEQRSKLCCRDLQLSQNHHWFLSQLIQLCPWLFAFFFSPCALFHGYKHRGRRAGDKEVWEWGRGRRISRNCSSEFHFFPHLLPSYLSAFLCAQILLYCIALLHHVSYKHNPFQQGTVTSCDYWKRLGKFCWWLTDTSPFTKLPIIIPSSEKGYESHQIMVNNSIPAYFLNFGDMAYFWKSWLHTCIDHY